MTQRKDNLQHVRAILIKKYLKVYDNGMAERLRTPWKDMLSLGTEEKTLFYYELLV